jgi:hypothetical protein
MGVNFAKLPELLRRSPPDKQGVTRSQPQTLQCTICAKAKSRSSLRGSL